MALLSTRFARWALVTYSNADHHKVRIMNLRMFARGVWFYWTRVATLLAVAALVGAGTILVGPIRAAKPVATSVPYAISDLGSPRYRNWSIYWSRAYGINEPTS